MQTGIAAAAYRAGDSLRGERITALVDDQGQAVCYDNGNPKMQRVDALHDYSRKTNITDSFIMAPQDAPEWVFDRQTLWNRMDAAERQWNAQRARDVQLTLPRELTHDQHVALVREFVDTEFISKGMIADIAFHNPPASDGKRNPHAHVLLAMRGLDGEDVAAKKNRQWNRDFTDGGINVDERLGGFTNSKGQGSQGSVVGEKAGLIGLRERWDFHVNFALADAGSTARVSHLSNQAQGIEREPQAKIGKHWYGNTRVAGSVMAERDAQRSENFKRQYLKSSPSARRRSQATTVAQNYALEAELRQGLYRQHEPEPPSRVWGHEHDYLQQQQERGHEQG